MGVPWSARSWKEWRYGSSKRRPGGCSPKRLNPDLLHGELTWKIFLCYMSTLLGLLGNLMNHDLGTVLAQDNIADALEMLTIKLRAYITIQNMGCPEMRELNPSYRCVRGNKPLVLGCPNLVHTVGYEILQRLLRLDSSNPYAQKSGWLEHQIGRCLTPGIGHEVHEIEVDIPNQHKSTILW